ncbi:TIGR01244 family sulfur transferase [Dongia sp.]|uniref:TIGR01244 family sulfur transferase n=1 Tax=Dongia sp. TaxID=1977262 RepID=UPI0035AE9E5F
MENLRRLTPFLSVAPQISEADVATLAARGYHSIINNRPDNEGDGQPLGAAIAAAAKASGMDYRHIPVVSGKVTEADVAAFRAAMAELKGPVFAYCRTGTRSTTLWALSEAARLDPAVLVGVAADAGYDLNPLRPRLEAEWSATPSQMTASGTGTVPAKPAKNFDIVIVGGGAAGCSVASSILKRRPALKLAIIEPKEIHYYQPGWTLVGGGVFDRRKTTRPMSDCIPAGVDWIKAAVATFDPSRHAVLLEDGTPIGYSALIVAPGLELRWDLIDGLKDTLGKNGVTSNYMLDLAPYTWELVQGLNGGTALFTQPPMPIKCAGAPQKAMYLSANHWEAKGCLKNITVEFNNAGGVLFGVKDYVPPLMKYVERYGAKLVFNSNLKSIDGPNKQATFEIKKDDGSVERVTKSFDMIHVVPPQTAPAFIRQSPLADGAGWVDVDSETLRHKSFGNIFALGDVGSTPNAKTAAAVRKQAPIVAENVIAILDGKNPRAIYDGYGSCPLTVERGKVILAEFGYGGKLLPTFPWDSTKPRWSAWFAKVSVLPWLYFDAMLKAREWLASPTILPHQPQPHESAAACADPTQRK